MIKIFKNILATEVTEATEFLRLKKSMESSPQEGYPAPTNACPFRFQLSYFCTTNVQIL